MSSNTGYIMTLANSIIGVGILAMPFCFQKCGILLSIVLLVLSNTITRLACYYLMKTSIKVRRKNFEFLASYIFGSSGKLMVELCVIGYLMGTCITYFVVVGDLGPQIVAKLFNISHSDSLRTFTMIVVTIFCIIPLSLLKNIESLSLICISSIIFYFCLVLKIFFESETKMLSSYWYDNVYWWRPSGILQCLPIFSMALSCQLQIFEIYESLPNQTIDRMNHIIKHGTGICTLVYICVGFFGYVAFYDQPFSGNVLLSLTPSLASDIIQMGFVLSVAVSFPLVVFPCRASLYSLLYHRVSASDETDDECYKHLDDENKSFIQPILQSHSETAHYIPEHRFKYITISMVLVALIIGILIPSIELIIGLVGSTIGVAICIMFPASCFIKLSKKNSTDKLLAQFLLVFGFSIMILGTYANLGAMDEQQSGANIQIDRLPDIHVTVKPSENILIPPANIEDGKDKIKIGPQMPDILQEHQEHQQQNDKIDGKRKIHKTTKLSPEIKHPVREIDLNEKVKEEIPIGKPQQKDPVVQIIEENIQPSVTKDEKSAIAPESAAIPKSNSIPNQLPEPLADKKSSDSVINNEAIKKEDQEIEIDADEKRLSEAKRTKEILDEVKNQLTKQNEDSQKLVLEKINEISEKVNNIAQMQNRSVAQQKVNELPPKIDVQTDSKGTGNNDMRSTNGDDEQSKKVLPPLPPVPVGSSAPVQQNVISEPDQQPAPESDLKLKQTNKMDDSVPEKPSVRESDPEKRIVEPPKVDKPNENVGRDLLSNSNLLTNSVKTSIEKTEN